MDTIIDQLKNIIISEIAPEKLILFGSYAYGKPGNDSDVDLLVMKDSDKSDVRKIRLHLKKAVSPIIIQNKKSVDIIVDSEERIRERINFGDLFLKDIVDKGKLLYAK